MGNSWGRINAREGAKSYSLGIPTAIEGVPFFLTLAASLTIGVFINVKSICNKAIDVAGPIITKNVEFVTDKASEMPAITSKAIDIVSGIISYLFDPTGVMLLAGDPQDDSDDSQDVHSSDPQDIHLEKDDSNVTIVSEKDSVTLLKELLSDKANLCSNQEYAMSVFTATLDVPGQLLGGPKQIAINDFRDDLDYICH